MPRIPITDNAGITIDLDLDSKSDAARLGLSHLVSHTGAFAKFADEPLDRTAFRSALFGGDYTTPGLNLESGLTLTLKAGVNTSLELLRDAGAASELALPVQPGDIWLSFRIDTLLAPAIGVATPSGFGLTGEKISVHSAAVYTRFSKSAGFPTRRDAAATAISNFRLVHSAASLREQVCNTISECELAGTFVLEGSYSYPFAVNATALASVKLPLHQTLTAVPDFELSLAGTLAVTGEFRFRAYRVDDTRARLGLYKKKETDLSAAFTAKAGASADVVSTDLLPPLFRAVGAVNLDPAHLPEDDQKAIRGALGKALDQGLSIALNLSCTAARADEAAVLYEIQLGADAPGIDAAINHAFAGNWTALNTLPSVRKLETVLTNTRETGFRATLNLLGLYSYATADDFVKACTVLHDLANGTVTISDRATAQRIAAAAAPFAVDSEKLRKVLEESFLATAVYSTATRNLRLTAEQKLLSYKLHQSYADLKKEMRLGTALRLLNAQDLAAIVPVPDFRYYRLSARASYEGEPLLQLFFADVASRAPRAEGDLKHLGRAVLISLLDETNPIDAARINALASDTIWAEMEQQQFPANSPASYSDWYDITHWAHAIAAVGPRLKIALDAWSTVSGDPSADPRFMAARDALAATLAEVTRNTRAAFEHGWPMAVMFALSQFRADASFEAQWNGAVQFEKRSERVLRAV